MKTAPTFRLALLTTLVLIRHSSLLLAQGPLTPPGAPAPTMKTLQELWDKVGGLETKVTALQQQVGVLQKDNGALGLLLENHNIILPWQRTTVDSTGIVDQFTSLAFTPAASPPSATTASPTATSNTPCASHSPPPDSRRIIL